MKVDASLRVFIVQGNQVSLVFSQILLRFQAYGWDTDKAVERAREQIAKAINAKRAQEIIFTSGATESNNLAIKGVAAYWGKQGKKHMITTEIEHKCVLASARELSVGPGIYKNVKNIVKLYIYCPSQT